MERRTCTLDGCDEPYLAKGLCNRHYLRWKKTGDPGYVGEIPQRTCDICGKDFMPYREYQKACSPACRKQLPEYVEAQRIYDSRPVRRKDRNVRRAVAVNPAQREVNLRSWLMRKYGLTLEQYQEKLASQGGLCAICGDPPKGEGHGAASRLHVDHDHVTNRNRALLCCRCNQGIGYFKDDPDLFQAAAEYIRRHRKEVIPGA